MKRRETTRNQFYFGTVLNIFNVFNTFSRHRKGCGAVRLGLVSATMGPFGPVVHPQLVGDTIWVMVTMMMKMMRMMVMTT